ncbi:hypothetical protein CRG98_013718 [Punica granatum]|uniref:Uncharacterized protein n=1 Tax=Punica granatum TaxID=22663 RepID=A0A2I0KBJ3_PUNGR|nr:hypothetical protein CRG98_013718 [Punica granatum]
MRGEGALVLGVLDLLDVEPIGEVGFPALAIDCGCIDLGSDLPSGVLKASPSRSWLGTNYPSVEKREEMAMEVLRVRVRERERRDNEEEKEKRD